MTEPTAPITQASRGWVLATTWLALAPLLLQLPGLLAGTIAVAALLVGVMSWRGSLMAPVRLLLVIAMLAAVYWQIGMRFGRDTGCAVLAAMLAIKASNYAPCAMRAACSALRCSHRLPHSCWTRARPPWAWRCSRC